MANRAAKIRFLRAGVGFLAVAVFAGAAVTAQGKSNVPHPKKKQDLKSQVEGLEQAWRTAQLNDDVSAMDKLLSDDYVGITMTGQVVTKMQQLDRMRNRVVVVSKIDLDDVKVKLIGTTAIVTSLASVEGTSDGDSMHGTYRYTRVYTRLPSGTWKITNFEATRVGPPPPPPQGQDGRRPRGKDPKSPDQ